VGKLLNDDATTCPNLEEFSPKCSLWKERKPYKAPVDTIEKKKISDYELFR
jgi:hypothetical protein